jgi:hypothetical protein
LIVVSLYVLLIDELPLTSGVVVVAPEVPSVPVVDVAPVVLVSVVLVAVALELDGSLLVVP